ncbi:phosphonate ABC transporter substrate-binding protein [Hydrocoleum sp. CS-953]|uniref:phosphonate ABC transporter substrate-binding protein n=1 Tax=Microcoleaceae TaxID=1892252 RepID=UPI000B9C0468|nr:phosphonate ABC transporter substrate-binding protein [Hydrocoleum sp. CS-953]OZH52293.1 phosphate ABC transporter substrate-binding protein [Hydrocoleum sp. CS-953]
MDRRKFVKNSSLFALSLAGAKLANLTLSSQTLAQVKEIKFGIISTESQTNQRPIWEPLIKAFSDSIGLPVKAFYVTQYVAVIEAMRTGNIHLAWYGGKSYIEAAKRANAEAFAQTVDTEGGKGYYSHLITNKNNPIVAEAKAMGGDKYVIKNAANLTFAFNDPNSTSGFLVPSYYVFAQNGVDPKKIFKRLVFSGSHEATALAIANNQVDVATNNNESLDRLQQTNPKARANIETIWTSTLIPSDPIAYRKDLPADLKQKIRNFFYNFKDAAVLKPHGWSGFDQANDQTWNPIRELDIAKQILELENKENLSAKDKQNLEQLRQELQTVKSN